MIVFIPRIQPVSGHCAGWAPNLASLSWGLLWGTDTRNEKERVLTAVASAGFAAGSEYFLLPCRNRPGSGGRGDPERQGHTDRPGKRLRSHRGTNHEGFFSFPDLTPATFTIAVEAPGFKIYKQTGILINADEQRSLGQIKLQVGQVSESVTITAEAVTVNTANGERAGTLSGEQLDEIALRGRDIFDAISLMPGVVDTSDGRDSPSPTSISNIYILGGRNDSKNMTIDGVTNLDTGSNTTVHSMPSMDSVAEVKVLMSAYSAENGRNPSSINVITKGGGTQYHGRQPGISATKT